MPGTILVSVLDFMDLPSSSPSSSISIKVSLGPRSEYQTWERRDLSFSLTTLRDNLIVLLQDSEGNQLSETGIETRSIVEKGVWDDFFPLKGGGFLHMKFQFVLNEEERNRIRMLRESVVQKKHGEFINSSPISVQSTPSAGINVASSLSLRNVISDRNEETSSGITVQQRVNLSPTELSRGKLVDNIDAQPLPAKIPAKAICSDEPARLLRGSQPVVGSTNLPKLQEDKPRKLEKQSPPEKTSRNVKNMISAFETGLAEDKKPRIKPASLGALGGTKSSPETGIKCQFRTISTSETVKEVDIKEDKLLKHFRTISTSETVKVSARVLDDQKHESSKMLDGKRHSGGSPVMKECHQPEISPTNYRKSDIQEVAAQIHTSIAHCEDRKNPLESSGGWMFPDEAIRFCITTSGKKVMDLLGSCSLMKPNIHQERKSSSPPENVEDLQVNVDSGNGNEVNRNGKNHRPKELHKVENSEETETSGVAVGQAIKVAIMIGFGTLVLLTRQRKDR